MDENFIEQSIAHQEKLLANAIAAARAPVASLPQTGHCHWCGEITDDDRRFCDVDCRADYDARQAADRRAGR